MLSFRQVLEFLGFILVVLGFVGMFALFVSVSGEFVPGMVKHLSGVLK